MLREPTEKVLTHTDMSDVEWESALTTANPSDLLPRRTGAISFPIQGPLAIVDSLALGEQVRLCIVSDATGKLFALPLILKSGVLQRAQPGDGAALALANFPIGVAQIGNFTLTVREKIQTQGERSMGVDQTEESVIVGEVAVVKYFSKIREVSRTSLPKIDALISDGFTFMPASFMTLEWSQSGSRYLLAEVAAFIPDALDGWTWAIDDAESLVDGRLDLASATACGDVLGEIISAMHASFLTRSSSHSQRAEEFSWVESARKDLALAMELGVGPDGEIFRALAPRISQVFDQGLQRSGHKLSLTHGDLHVGQVLRTPRLDYFVIDFDGNPIAEVTSDPNQQPLLQDLASLLQSIDHVAQVVDKRRNFTCTVELKEWVHCVQEKIRKVYEKRLGLAVDEELLRLFQIQQECREFIYAQKHLPVWRYVPEAALASLMKDN